MGRTLLFVPLGVYLFVYPNGIWLLALGLLPSDAGWVGGVLLIAQAAAMLTWLALNYGARRGLLAGLLIGALAWALEAVGVSTGVPFGVYSYTPALGAFLGPVPLAIPFAWIATVGAALGTARLLLNRPTDAWAIATLAALLAAGQDFVLEPIATFTQGYWNWHDATALVYGVPAQNFLTWFVAALLLARLALAIVGPRSASYYPWLPPLLLLLAVFMFGLLDLVGGYYLAALLALPLLIGAALLVARVFPRRLRRLGRVLGLGRSLRAIVPLLLVSAIALQGCGGDDIFVVLTPTPVATPTTAPTPIPTATIPPTSTPLPPTDTPSPTVTPTPAPPTATPVVLAPDPTTTSTLLLGALDAMEALASYEYTATISSHGPGTTVANSIAGVFQAPDRLYWTNATKAITSEQVLSGTLYYVAYTPGEWIQAGGAAKARNGQLLWPLVAYGEDAELIDQPEEDGETLLHIGFSIPPAKLLLDSRNWIKATAEVWLSSTTRRVLALKLIAYDDTYDTTQRYYFFNFDQPVQIPQPAP